MNKNLKIENLIKAIKIQTMDKKSFENFKVELGKRFLVRYKPYLTKDDYYDGQLINGVVALDFEIKVVEQTKFLFKVEIEKSFYWIDKNKIFNWSERNRKHGWVVTEELSSNLEAKE